MRIPKATPRSDGHMAITMKVPIHITLWDVAIGIADFVQGWNDATDRMQEITRRGAMDLAVKWITNNGVGGIFDDEFHVFDAAVDRAKELFPELD